MLFSIVIGTTPVSPWDLRAKVEWTVSDPCSEVIDEHTEGKRLEVADAEFIASDDDSAMRGVV
jgi:hypothetical protein